MNKDQVEKIGELADKADAFLELIYNVAMTPKMKVDAAQTGFSEIRDALKELYIELGGEDVWDEE